jgi:hypothetical protein
MAFFTGLVIGLIIGILIGILMLATIYGIAEAMMQQRAPSRDYPPGKPWHRSLRWLSL